MKLHSRLSDQSNKALNTIKSKSMGKEAFNTAEVNAKEARPLRPEYILGDKGSGESTLHEIQAIIISQEIKENNAKMLKNLNDPLSMQIAHLDSTKQRKSIPEKFKRKKFHSLAIDLQKTKQSNLGFPGVDKENMKPNSHHQKLEQLGIFTKHYEKQHAKLK